MANYPFQYDFIPGIKQQRNTFCSRNSTSSPPLWFMWDKPSPYRKYTDTNTKLEKVKNTTTPFGWYAPPPNQTNLVHKHQLPILFIPRMTLDPLPPSIQYVATSGCNHRDGGCFVVVTVVVVCVVLIHGSVRLIPDANSWWCYVSRWQMWLLFVASKRVTLRDWWYIIKRVVVNNNTRNKLW